MKTRIPTICFAVALAAIARIGYAASSSALADVCHICDVTYSDSQTGSDPSGCELGVRKVICMGGMDPGCCDDATGQCIISNACTMKLLFEFTSCCDDNALDLKCHNTDCDLGTSFCCTADATTSCGSTSWQVYPNDCVVPCIFGTPVCGAKKYCCAFISNDTQVNRGALKLEVVGDCDACP